MKLNVNFAIVLSNQIKIHSWEFWHSTNNYLTPLNVPSKEWVGKSAIFFWEKVEFNVWNQNVQVKMKIQKIINKMN